MPKTEEPDESVCATRLAENSSRDAKKFGCLGAASPNREEESKQEIAHLASSSDTASDDEDLFASAAAA